MTFVFVGLLCLFAAAWVLLPLRVARADIEYSMVDGGEPKKLDDEMKRLQRQSRDIEFDRSLGKIGDADFAQLQSDIQTQMETVAQQLNSKTVAPTMETHAPDFDLETEILIVRARRKRAARKTQTPALWSCSCGREMSQADSFCASCGAARS